MFRVMDFRTTRGLTPEEFVSLRTSKPEAIVDTQFIPPRLGDEGFVPHTIHRYDTGAWRCEPVESVRLELLSRYAAMEPLELRQELEQFARDYDWEGPIDDPEYAADEVISQMRRRDDGGDDLAGVSSEETAHFRTCLEVSARRAE